MFWNSHIDLIIALFDPLGAKRDEDGYLWITGRIDDMVNVSGHLLSTAEVESALIEHDDVAEAASVSHPHPIKGECIYCFVSLKAVRKFCDWNPPILTLLMPVDCHCNVHNLFFSLVYTSDFQCLVHSVESKHRSNYFPSFITINWVWWNLGFHWPHEVIIADPTNNPTNTFRVLK